MTPNSSGVQFPTDSAGNRSSGRLAKQVVADALSTVDPAAGERVHRIKDWRKGYIRPFTELVSAGFADAAAWDGQRGLLPSDLMPHLRRLANP